MVTVTGGTLDLDTDCDDCSGETSAPTTRGEVALGPPDLNSVVGKVRVILEALAANGGMGLSELSRASGVAKPSVYRICGELLSWGVVERSGDRFRLGAHLFELGQRVPSHRLLRDAALPYMEDLFVATRQVVHLAVPRDTEVLYVERITGHASDRVPSAVATRLPMSCTATGKSLLAFLPSSYLDEVLSRRLVAMTPYSIVAPQVLRDDLTAVRTNGFSIEREELKIGYTSIAAPVFGRGGELLAAVSITASVRHIDWKLLAPAVKTAARGLSRALGARTWPAASTATAAAAG